MQFSCQTCKLRYQYADGETENSFHARPFIIMKLRRQKAKSTLMILFGTQVFQFILITLHRKLRERKKKECFSFFMLFSY